MPVELRGPTELGPRHSTSVLKALPSKLDIKRRELGILLNSLPGGSQF